MRSTWLVLATCAACSFDGSGGPSDGPPAGEDQMLLDSAADFTAGSPVTEGAYVSAAGTIEPMAWLPGLLLAEIDDAQGPFGTWAQKPTRTDLINVGLMAPPFDPGPKPPGTPSGNVGYILWFSGEVRLDAGAQKLALSTANSAEAFADVLDASGAVLAACNSTTECAVTAPTAGWYRLHMGWNRPMNAANNSFELQWGLAATTAIALDRLRVAVHEPQLAGWAIEGHEFQRSISHLVHGTALNYKEPFSLTWKPSLLGLDGNGSPSYRNAGQLRLLGESTSYDFSVTAGSEAAYRLWIDGEWVTQPGRWNPQVGGGTEETVSRTLAAGWHDVVLEGYEQGGTGNTIQLTFGKTGQALKPPAIADARPLLGVGTSVVAVLNPGTVNLVKDTFVPQLVTIPAIANAPGASAVDLWLRLQPKVWSGLEVRLRSPGSATNIPLTIDVTGLLDDQPGDVHASVPKALLGNATVSGTWTLEIKHPNAGGVLGGANSLSRARVSVHYKGGPTVGSPEKQLATEGHYVRTVSLDKARELRGLVLTAVQPTGSKIEAGIQICTDAAGLDCAASLTAEQVATTKPTAQHLKVVVSFTSDGFASPILDKLALRYKE
jgi:hypothetical protein